MYYVLQLLRRWWADRRIPKAETMSAAWRLDRMQMHRNGERWWEETE